MGILQGFKRAIFDTLPLWFPSETNLNHNVGWQDGALAVALNYGEGETMFVSGRIYINLGTCEIWGHLFALLKNLKHEQHKSPTGCWQCFTKQLLTWSLESDLMKLLCCNFAYMRRQWSFAESSCPSGSRKGNCKKKTFCQLQCKDIRLRTFGFWRHYPQILNTPFGISNWTGS